MALNPVLQGGAAYNSPVQQPDMVGIAADLISGFLSTKGIKQPKGPTEGEIERAGMKFLGEEFLVANELRAQGRDAEANMRERNALLKGGKDYGLNVESEAVSGMYTNTTGRPFNYAGKSPDEATKMSLYESEDFQTSILATYGMPGGKDFSDEEREQIATTLVVQKAANDAVIQQSQTQWMSTSQNAYLSTMESWTQSFAGILDGSAVANGEVTVEQLHRVQGAWNAEKMKMTKPPHVTDEQWAPIKAKQDAIDNAFAFALGMDKNIVEGMSAQNKRYIMEAFVEADSTVGGRIVSEITTNPEMLSTVWSANPERFASFVDNMVAIFDKPVGPVDLTYGGGVPPKVMEDINAMPTSKKTGLITEGLTIASDASLFSQITKNPSSKDFWVNSTAKGLYALQSLNEGTDNSWTNKSFLETRFTPQFWANMDQLKTVDPDVFEELSTIAYGALDNQRVTAAASRDAIIGDGSKYVIVDGQVSISPDNQYYAKMKPAVDKYYGGDFAAAIADGGKAIPRFGREDIPTGRGTSREAIQSDPELRMRSQGIAAITQFRSSKDYRTVVDANDTVNWIDDKLGMLSSEAVESVEEMNAEVDAAGSGSSSSSSAGGSLADQDVGMMNNYFAAIRQAESGGNDGAKNPLSSATGRYQFVKSTWDSLVDRYPGAGITKDGRFDPEQQEIAIRLFTNENVHSLKAAGIPITGGSLYAAHFLGAGGAKSVLTKTDETPLTSILPESVIKANPFLRGMTVGKFKQWANKKGGGSGEITDFGSMPTTAVATGETPGVGIGSVDYQESDTTVEAVGGPSGGQVDISGSGVAETGVSPVEASGEAEGSTASSAVASGEDARLSERSQAVLQRLGINGTSNIPSFATISEAVKAGVQEGTPVMIDGEVVVM